MKKMSGVSLAVAMLVLVGVNRVQGSTIIFQQDFNGYADGTPLAAVGGWYDWAAAGNATIQGGVVAVSGSMDFLLDFGSDIFSYGNTQARIEFDLLSYQQDDLFLGPGTASAPNFNYDEALGFEHGAGLLYHYNQTGFDYGSTVSGVPDPLGAYHWVFDITKLGNQYTWNATYGGNPLLLLGAHSLTITDVRGLNTMEFYTLGGAGSTVDNIVISYDTGGDVPEPGTLLILGGSLLGLFIGGFRRFRKK